MDQSIEQLARDLTLAKYAKSTQERYTKEAAKVGEQFGKSIVEVP